MGLSNITEIRKREIVEAFYQTAIKEGLESTSIAKIAKTLNIQPSLIVHYYKTKDELITALIDHCLELYLKIFEKAYLTNEDPLDMLVSLINSMFSKDWNDLFDDGVYYSAYAMVFREPAFREKFSKIHKELRVKFSSLLKDCDNTGAINCKNPNETANRIFFLLDGTYFFINMLSTQKEQDEHLKQSKLLSLEMLGLKK
ncbi:TetR family transcriptional regulator [Belliella sp. R4-6]|uniref:Biofilm operon icaADBC HTH-type negative transcriptional regulator IcaR n=1 Tax=Belliella alkalica TaxID=1730871 RepID=A0ABS9V6S6_9BACT|nr:TetR family transcriptional regulator [Belliella alkalica]MCH7412078.1 TetR family transcriptional regulator [Belliella alkalica]